MLDRDQEDIPNNVSKVSHLKNVLSLLVQDTSFIFYVLIFYKISIFRIKITIVGKYRRKVKTPSTKLTSQRKLTKMFLVKALFCLLVTETSNAARILGLVPTPSYSHQHFFHPIWRELSLRGHNVTILTTDPVNAPELTNLTQIDMRSAYKYVPNFRIQLLQFNPVNYLWYLHELFDIINEYELSHPKVQQLIQTNESFDLVLTESLHPEFMAFGEIFNCPIVLISSFKLQNIIHVAVGNPSHPVLYPEYTLPFYGKLSFKERIISTCYEIYTYFYMTYTVFPRRDELAIRYFGKNIPSIKDMLKKVSMIFVASDPVKADTRALGTMTISIGAIHLLPPIPLSKVSSMKYCVYFTR